MKDIWTGFHRPGCSQYIYNIFQNYYCIPNIFLLYSQYISTVFSIYFFCTPNKFLLYFQYILTIFPIYFDHICNIFSPVKDMIDRVPPGRSLPHCSHCLSIHTHCQCLGRKEKNNFPALVSKGSNSYWYHGRVRYFFLLRYLRYFCEIANNIILKGDIFT